MLNLELHKEVGGERACAWVRRIVCYYERKEFAVRSNTQALFSPLSPESCRDTRFGLTSRRGGGAFIAQLEQHSGGCGIKERAAGVHGRDKAWPGKFMLPLRWSSKSKSSCVTHDPLTFVY